MYKKGDIIIPICDRHKNWGERVILKVIRNKRTKEVRGYIWSYPDIINDNKDWSSLNSSDPLLNTWWKLKQ